MARFKPAPSTRTCRRRARAQRGDALLEALVAMVLLGVVSLGMVYALSRVTVAQKYQKAQSLAVQAIRATLQSSGIANGCPSSGANSSSATLVLSSSVSLSEVQISCTVTAVSVSVNGVSKTATVPVVQYAVSAQTLLGPGTLTVGN
jgi:type II secretory pathway pseudopilin PulG